MIMGMKLRIVWFLIHVLIQTLGDQVQGEYVNVTLVQTAVPKGAVCLDGSPPGYAMAPGSGCGSKNWIVYLQGGAWCDTEAVCAKRAKNETTGSSFRTTRVFFSGMLGRNQTFNPDFYNWNRVYLIYCDGSSFLGDVEEVDPETKLFYRGSRVFDAIMEELLSKGMDTAENVILSGSSAGGLATILHCDRFRALLPNVQRVKCLSDSAFFLHAPNLPGAMYREDYFYRIIKLHELERFLPESCTSRQRNLSLCMFPEYLVDDVQTPLFLLESSFDAYQIPYMIIPYIGGGETEWHNCPTVNLNFKSCNSTQLRVLREFHESFIHALHDLDYSSSRGIFVHSCYQHGHVITTRYWKCSCVSNMVVHNKTIADAVGEWYFNRHGFQHIDTKNNIPLNCVSPLDADAFNKKCLELIK